MPFFILMLCSLLQSNSKTRFILKAIALFLSLSFLLSDLAWAAPLELSVKDIAHDPNHLKISPRFAKITDSHKGTKPRLLVHIQDAHTNPSAQENLASTLEELIKKYHFQKLFLEGGTKDDSLTALRPLADAKTRKRAAKKYLLSGELNGAEYLNVVSDIDMELWGVEEKNLYRKSLHDYAAVVREREKVLAYLEEIRRRASTLKQRLYPKEMLYFDEFLGRYRKKERDFTDYQKLLEDNAARLGINLLGYPNFLSLRALKEKEGRIDFSRANREQKFLVETLLREEELAPEFSKLKNQTTVPVSFCEILLKKAAERGLDPRRTQNIALYTEYLRYYSRVHLEKLMEETRRLEERIFRESLKTEELSYLYEIDRHLGLLQNLFRLQSTHNEFEEYSRARRDVRFQTIVMLAFLNKRLYDFGGYGDILKYEPWMEDNEKKAGEFYETARKRDEVFLKKAMEKMERENIRKAILITGGFHTPNLKALMRQREISYAVIAPNVDYETNQSRYEEILLSPLKGGRSYKKSGHTATAGRDSFLQTMLLADRPESLPILTFRKFESELKAGSPATRHGGQAAGARLALAASKKWVEEIEAKKGAYEATADFEIMNQVAGDVLREVAASGEFWRKALDKIGLPEQGILTSVDLPEFTANAGLYAQKVSAVASVLADWQKEDPAARQEAADLFYKSLFIAYKIKDTEAHKHKDRKDEDKRRLNYERSYAFAEAARKIRPGDPVLLVECATVLFHLAKYDKERTDKYAEVEALLKPLFENGHLPRAAFATMGYMKRETVRVLLWNLQEALRSREFDRALILLAQIEKTVNEGRKYFNGILVPFAKDKDSATDQVPRCYSGMSGIEAALSEAYLEAQASPELVKSENYELMALKHAVRAFSFSVAALALGSSEELSVEHSADIYEDTLKTLRRALTAVRQAPLAPQEIGELDRIFYALGDGIEDHNEKVVKVIGRLHEPERSRFLKALDALVRQIHTLRTDVEAEKDRYRRLTQLVVAEVLDLCSSTDYADIRVFHEDLRRAVTAKANGYPAEALTAAMENIAHFLNLGVVDLSVIKWFQASRREGVHAETLSGWVKEDLAALADGLRKEDREGEAQTAEKEAAQMSPERLARRFKSRGYRLLFDEAVSLPRQSPEEFQKGTVLTNQNPAKELYDKGRIAFALSADKTLIQRIERDCALVFPWLEPEYPEKIARFEEVRRQLEKAAAHFEGTARQILESREPLSRWTGELQNLTSLREGKSGYWPKALYLADKLDNEIRLEEIGSQTGIRRRIRAGMAEVEDYRSRIQRLISEFGFEQLGFLSDDLVRIREEVSALLIEGSQEYLSRARFDALLEEAEAVYGWSRGRRRAPLNHR